MKNVLKSVIVCLVMVMVMSGMVFADVGQEEECHPDKWQRTEGSVTVDEGVELKYVMEGRGIPCIFVGMSQYYPQLVSKRLKRHFRFIFVDERACVPGLTQEQVNAVTLDTLVDDMEKVRRALGFDKVAVMGHSVHGLFALNYAAKYPQHTSHCIIVGVYPCGFAEGSPVADQYWANSASQERKDILQSNMEQLAIDVVGKTPSEAFVMDYVAKAPLFWYDPYFDCSHFWQGTEINMLLLPRLYYDIFLHHDFDAKMETVTAPIFVAIGEYDYQVPYFLWDDAIAKYPRISFNLFSKSAHTPFYEQPRRFDRKLIRWVRRNRCRPEVNVTQ